MQEVLKLSEGEIAEIIQSAFKKRKYDLIKKYVDVKKQNLTFKEQSDKAGELAAEASNLFQKYNPQCIHGKEMLRAIRDELANRKVNDSINSQSNALRNRDISVLF